VSTRERPSTVRWRKPRQPAIREDRSRAELGVGGEHYFQSHDIIARDPVFQAAQAA
jgi:hypothetical protein